MKNPCLSCDHHLAGGDKNCDRCRECDKRVEYVQLIGSVAASMDIAAGKPLSYQEVDMEKITRRETGPGKAKICRRPDCELAGKPQPLDNFPQNKSCKDGHEGVCKKCKARQAKARRQGKKKLKIDSCDYKGTPAKNIVTIDFTGHDDLWQQLHDIASAEFRDPDRQILYWLKNTGCCGES